jgi:TRAP-type C4-dicarboxylate transport system substrate-binding protein
LPADLQQIFTEVSQEWIPKHGQAWDDADEEGLQFITGLKKEVSTIAPAENDKAAKALAPLFEQWVQETKQKNLPGQEAMDFIRTKLGR